MMSLDSFLTEEEKEEEEEEEEEKESDITIISKTTKQTKVS